MTTPTHPPNLQDDRWGSYVPWLLRHPDFAILGQFDIFFDRVAHRLKQVVNRGEAGISSVTDLGDTIESDSHQCFRYNSGEALAAQIESYFAPTRIASEAEGLTNRDPFVVEATQHYTALITQISQKKDVTDIPSPTPRRSMISSPLLEMARIQASPVAKEAAGIRDKTRSVQREVHYKGLVLKRLTVLESVLRLVKATPAFPQLRDILRKYLAEAQIMLDIAEEDGRIVPMEEALLQKEVIDRLLPRLTNRFPQQEKDLVKAYHDLVQGVDANTVFGNAFKALEEVVRQMTGNNTLELNKEKNLRRYFPHLHPTVYTTIMKLADHRGDKGGHGRKGPPLHEMRYLLFSICNVALLFLDYPPAGTPDANPESP
ncbi:MAG: hypothetical protein E6K65_15995 [Nitrospirae bacterium]|nr:MAG: hypothetical protein E6K65_15995 [Nitrospirota bacterium]